MSAARAASLAGLVLALAAGARADGDLVVGFETLPAAPAPAEPAEPPGRLVATLQAPGGSLPADLRVAGGTLDAATGAVECKVARGGAAVVLYVGRDEAWRRDLHVPAGERRVTLALGTGVGLHGRVLGADGAPMRGARIGLEGAEADDPGLERGLITAQAVAGDDGRFAFPWLPASDVTLDLVQADDTRRRSVWQVHVPAAGLELDLDDRTAWIEGTLFAPDGSPVAGATVMAFPVWEEPAPAPGARVRLQMGTDAWASPAFGWVQEDGRFALPVLGGRRVALRAILQGRDRTRARWSALSGAVVAAPGAHVHVPPLGLAPADAEGAQALVRVDVSGVPGSPFVAGQLLGVGAGGEQVLEGMLAGAAEAGAFLFPGQVYTVRIVRPGGPAWLLREVKVTGPARLRPTPPR